LIKNIR